MKKISKFFFKISIIFLPVSCVTEQIVIDQPILVETPELKSTLITVEDAFLQADTKKLESLILPNYLVQYKSYIENNQSKLAEFGKIFKTRN